MGWKCFIVRRLRRAQEKGTLNNLIRAITTKDRDTACIRIPRSLDGRMQGRKTNWKRFYKHHISVRQKKTIPHVLFCQIFRWDNLKSYHELQGIVSCRFAYGKPKPNPIFNKFYPVFQICLKVAEKSVSIHIITSALVIPTMVECNISEMTGQIMNNSQRNWFLS